MNAGDLIALGNKYQAEGKLQLAAEVFREAGQHQSPFGFGPAWLNLHTVLVRLGDLNGARQALVNFMNCPLLPSTVDFLPKVKQELENLEKQLNPQPQPK